jgi:proteasome lid subunit RPN8/RPN11
LRSLALAAAARALIEQEARAGYPHESCGALVGRFAGEAIAVPRAIPLANHADEAVRRRRFTVDPREVLRIERELRGGPQRLVGFYHSHPDAEAVPSTTDLEFFRLWPETVWIIAAVRGGTPDPPRAWWLADPDGTPVELEIVEQRDA